MINFKKPYVRIQSQQTIKVTAGLSAQNNTNEDAHVPDRLKVSATWQKVTMIIKAGAFVYPSEIIEWPTVKSLERDGIITIGAFEDQANAEVVAKREELLRNLKEVGLYKEELEESIVEEDLETGEYLTTLEKEEALADKINKIRLADIAE